MSEEIMELMKDYKGISLHEHLFEGADDLKLTKLDLLYDSAFLDID